MGFTDHRSCGSFLTFLLATTAERFLCHRSGFAISENTLSPPDFQKKSENLEVKNMAYNKAREELKWLLWKTAEEQKLRELGVSEDRIQDLHVYDWAMFKANRNYYNHIQEVGDYLETVAAVEDVPEVRNVDDLLDEIENPELFRILLTVDRVTLQIAVLKINGRTGLEISKALGISENAVKQRWKHLKEKIEKNL
jgi:hypothetical protein